MELFFCALAAYLYGSIPFGLIASRLIKGKNLCKLGTDNITVTNAFKVGGYAVGIIALLGEVSKAAIPIGAARLFFHNDLYATLLLFYLSLVGTCFSIFLMGRGGKGSTLAIWGLLLLSPYTCIILLLITIVFLKIAKNKPAIKKIPLFLIPVVIYLIESDLIFTFFGMLTSILFIVVRLKRKDDFAYYSIFRKNRDTQNSDAPWDNPRNTDN